MVNKSPDEPGGLSITEQDRRDILEEMLSAKATEILRLELDMGFIKRDMTNLKDENKRLHKVIEKLRLDLSQAGSDQESQPHTVKNEGRKAELEKLAKTENPGRKVKRGVTEEKQEAIIILDTDNEDQNSEPGYEVDRGCPATVVPSDDIDDNMRIAPAVDIPEPSSLIQRVPNVLPNGTLDIWNLDGELGPTVRVKDKYNVWFTPKVISNAFGYGQQAGAYHWQGRAAGAVPFLTTNRSWNPHVPVSPGEHGILFSSFDTFGDGSTTLEAIDFVVRDGKGHGQYKGTYRLQFGGKLSPSHLNLLPARFLALWIRGALKKEWGKKWIDNANQEGAQSSQRGIDTEHVERTEAGMQRALHNGSLVIRFIVMKCIGYKRDWFKRLLFHQANPEPPKTTQPNKRKAVSQGGTSCEKKSRKDGREDSDGDSGGNQSSHAS